MAFSAFTEGRQFVFTKVRQSRKANLEIPVSIRNCSGTVGLRVNSKIGCFEERRKKVTINGDTLRILYPWNGSFYGKDSLAISIIDGSVFDNKNKPMLKDFINGIHITVDIEIKEEQIDLYASKDAMEDHLRDLQRLNSEAVAMFRNEVEDYSNNTYDKAMKEVQRLMADAKLAVKEFTESRFETMLEKCSTQNQKTLFALRDMLEELNKGISKKTEQESVDETKRPGSYEPDPAKQAEFAMDRKKELARCPSLSLDTDSDSD